ncbi:MAG: hypothetical protein IJX36_02765, partial [Thermoguttaceae bacterium]|nr:hypothetical protein [Thermoguttaceae bacterium]
MGKMWRIGGNIDGAATVGRAPKWEKRLAVDGANRSAFEYTRRAAEMQAFRRNFCGNGRSSVESAN